MLTCVKVRRDRDREARSSSRQEMSNLCESWCMQPTSESLELRPGRPEMSYWSSLSMKGPRARNRDLAQLRPARQSAWIWLTGLLGMGSGVGQVSLRYTWFPAGAQGIRGLGELPSWASGHWRELTRRPFGME